MALLRPVTALPRPVTIGDRPWPLVTAHQRLMCISSEQRTHQQRTERWRPWQTRWGPSRWGPSGQRTHHQRTERWRPWQPRWGLSRSFRDEVLPDEVLQDRRRIIRGRRGGDPGIRKWGPSRAARLRRDSDWRDEQQLPGDGAPPLSNFAPPTSDGTPLVSNVAPPTGDSTPPVSNTAPPTGDGASPVSNGALSIGYCVPPLSNGAPPTDECAPPASNGALPTATESGDPPCESVRLLREFEQMLLDSRLHSAVTIRTLIIA